MLPCVCDDTAMASSPLPPKRVTMLLHEDRMLHISDLSRAMLGSLQPRPL
jgi:hypothetical protein